MKLGISTIDQVTGGVEEFGLLSSTERERARSLASPDFAFAEAVGAADCVHLHVKVEDAAALPPSVAAGAAR